MKNLFSLVIATSFLLASCGGSNTAAPKSTPAGTALAASPGTIPGAATEITIQDARQMVSAYHRDSVNCKLGGDDGNTVAWFVDRNSLEALLKEPTTDGIRLYLAKNMTTGNPSLCLIPTTPDSTNNSVHNNVSSPIFEFIYRCPKTCNLTSSTELYLP